nr:MAG TPA: hypothetical protein [Caudoviricetes sp.]
MRDVEKISKIFCISIPFKSAYMKRCLSIFSHR